MKKTIPDGPSPDSSTPHTYKNNGIKVIGPANIIKLARLRFCKLKSLLFVVIIKYSVTIIIGSINRHSINKPISVSTLIFFLSKLYKLQRIATLNPTHGNEENFNNK